MNALLKHEGIAVTAGRSFWVMFTDESGLIPGSYITAGDWRHYDAATLLQLVKAAHPSRDVVAAKFVENPRDYAISSDVLLVSVPGTHVVPAPPKPKKRKARRDAEDVEVERESYPLPSRSDRIWDAIRSGRSESTPRPVDVSTEVVAEHCGISFTITTFRDLPLLDAKGWDEGFTHMHQEQRRCRCGSALTVTTKRLMGEKR